MLSAEVASLETALHESEQCNASLTQLVQLLQDEMQRQEERRTRERLRVHRRLSGPLVPREALDSARSMLEEGSTALVAAHEHTLRLAEMRMAAMAEQLNRLSSALPHKEKVEEAPPMQLQPPSPTQSLIRTGFVSLLADDTDDTWAEPGLGGLCLDSLPLHVPSAGSHAAVTGGAYGIHGRRAAISTAPWSASPAALATGWWENRSLLEVAADGEPSTPPSPDGDATELVVAAGAMARTSGAPTLQAMERSADRGAASKAAAALEIAAAEGAAAEAAAAAAAAPGRRRSALRRALTGGSGGAVSSQRRASTSVRRRPGDLPRAAELFDLPSWAAADEQLRGASLSLAGWGDAALDSAARDTAAAAAPPMALGDGGVAAADGGAASAETTTDGRSGAWWRPRASSARSPASRGARRSSVSLLSTAGQQALGGAMQGAIARHPILSTLSPDLRRDTTASCMRELRVRAGTTVAAQGAECDAFVVVGSGVFDGYIAESGPMPVREYKRGDSFGELGLVCACTHTATVRCREPGTLWLLERLPFQRNLLSICERRADSSAAALRRVACLSGLTDGQLTLLATALQEVALPPGAVLLRRHEPWDGLYIVCSGSLEDRHVAAARAKIRVKGLNGGGGGGGGVDREAAARGRIILAGEHVGEESLREALSPTQPAPTPTAQEARRASLSVLVPGASGAPGVSAGVPAPPSPHERDRTDDAQTAQAEMRKLTSAASVLAGDGGCVLLRLPPTALVEALHLPTAAPVDGTGQIIGGGGGSGGGAGGGGGVLQPAVATEVEAKGAQLLARLADAEPALAAAFTSPGQRAQLLSVLEVVRPNAGEQLQKRGEPSDGILLLEAGCVLKGTPWAAAAPSRGRRDSVSSVCGVGIVGVRRGSSDASSIAASAAVAAAAAGAHDASIVSASPPPATASTLADDEAPLTAGACVGSLGAQRAPTALFAHAGVVAYRLPRRAALVILAPTHELVKGVLTPRATPYHIRRPPPPPPPLSSLVVAGLLGEGGTSRVLLVRKLAPGTSPPPPLHGSPAHSADGSPGGVPLATPDTRRSPLTRRRAASSSGDLAHSRGGTSSVSGAAHGSRGRADTFGGVVAALDGGVSPQGSSPPSASGGGGREGGSAPDESEYYALKILKRGGRRRGQGGGGGGGGSVDGIDGADGAGRGGGADGDLARQAARERRALAACNHQFIPQLAGAVDGYLMMEAVRGCELFYLLREVHRFEPGTASFYTAMVLSALAHLHCNGLIHRDVKPENLVLDGEGYLRLVDLGLCRPLAHPAERAYTLCGTPEYTAPEVLRGSGHGKEADLWSVGVLLFELLAGYPAFCADDPIKVYSLVLNAAPSIPRSFPREAKELIALLLRPAPHTRLGAMRGGSVDVACHSFFDAIDWLQLLSRKVEAPLIPVIADTAPDPAELAKLQMELPQPGAPESPLASKG